MLPWNTLFSSHPNQKSFLKNLQQHDVQSFIDKVFSEVMTDTIKHTASQGSKAEQHPLDANVLETHSFIYIRIPIEDENWLKKMKIFHTSNQSIIQDVPNEHDKHVITLPALVRKKGSSVHYQDHILEICLQKQTDPHYAEIDMSDL